MKKWYDNIESSHQYAGGPTQEPTVSEGKPRPGVITLSNDIKQGINNMRAGTFSHEVLMSTKYGMIGAAIGIAIGLFTKHNLWASVFICSLAGGGTGFVISKFKNKKNESIG